VRMGNHAVYWREKRVACCAFFPDEENDAEY